MTREELNKILSNLWHTNEYPDTVDKDFIESVVLPAMVIAYNRALDDALKVLTDNTPMATIELPSKRNIRIINSYKIKEL